MKITWLGQAGLLFETEKATVMIDPYLSDSCARLNPNNHRRVPVEEALFDIKPNLMIFTHNHLDHYDPETVEKFIKEDSGITVLAPNTVWPEVRKLGGNNNYVQFDRHTHWSQYGLTITAVKATHSDAGAIGVIIDDGEKKYYVTGDTLYNSEIFSDLPDDIYAVFLPVNGVGNNMNMCDAADFARKTGAEKVVPLHIGLFDSISAHDFKCENKVVPTFYKEIKL
ncbi:MAG: MBL fold metallo-hydrolase [Acutalibacteraceae bacterium]|nr:MBL fold metallo-hydrolase [Acutalibacteraceae bacterium]